MAEGDTASASADVGAALRRRRLPPLFDDKARYLDRFGVQLLLVILTVVILALLDLSEPETQVRARAGIIFGFILVVITLLLALRASGMANRWALIVDGIAAVSVIVIIVLNVVGAISGVAFRATPAPILISLLALITPVVIIRRLLQHRQITRGTLFGAISAYLLIAVAYFFVFLSASELGTIPFFGEVEPTTNFMYFSLTTITTTGYGDLTAKTDVGHLLATSEAVIGQIYLVTFVALLVGLYASSRHQRFIIGLPGDDARESPKD